MKFTIDRTTWGRGKTGGRLYNANTGLMCCLGQVGEQCGIRKISMKDLGVPSVVGDAERYPVAIVDEFEETHDDEIVRYKETTALADAMMRVNDSTEISDEEREEKLIKLAAGKDIELVFVN